MHQYSGFSVCGSWLSHTKLNTTYLMLSIMSWHVQDIEFPMTYKRVPNRKKSVWKPYTASSIWRTPLFEVTCTLYKWYGKNCEHRISSFFSIRPTQSLINFAQGKGPNPKQSLTCIIKLDLLWNNLGDIFCRESNISLLQNAQLLHVTNNSIMR